MKITSVLLAVALLFAAFAAPAQTLDIGQVHAADVQMQTVNRIINSPLAQALDRLVKQNDLAHAHVRFGAALRAQKVQRDLQAVQVEHDAMAAAPTFQAYVAAVQLYIQAVHYAYADTCAYYDYIIAGYGINVVPFSQRHDL